MSIEHLAQQYASRKGQIGSKQRAQIRGLLANLATIIVREPGE